ncbi:MAG: PilX N-terminal domain-containing pilus assembly protein [Gallionella sp.]|nr:PilX N-terminal domain-containing pilus assembly protein [Gallionella sp.]
MKAFKQQRGSTLLVALIMLVLLTLIAVSAMKSTTSSIQVVGNAQFREEAKAAAQKAIELVLSDDSSTNFRNIPVGNTLPEQRIDVNADGTADYTVTFARPSCLSSAAVIPGQQGIPPVCAAQGGLAVCFWTRWDIRAVVSDVNTGASVVLHQGVKTIAGLNDVVAAGC